MANNVVIPLLIIAGVLNNSRSITVAINYSNGARLGHEIRHELSDEESWRHENPMLSVLEYSFAGDLNIDSLNQRVATLRERVARFLLPQPMLVVGIICYFTASALDTIGVLEHSSDESCSLFRRFA